MFERIEVGSPNRPWATALAFLVNATALTLAILLPMIRPDRLPAFAHVVTPPITIPYFHDEAPAQPQPQRSSTAQTPFDDHVIRIPATPPTGIDMRPGPAASGPHPSADPFLHIIGSGPVSSVPLGTTSNPPPIPATTTKARPEKLIISHLDEGMLIRRVQPVYSRLAIATHTQGSVVLSALINTRGEIEGLQVVSGPPLLVQAALDAVKQWRYRPYILNGTPIEVQTQVTVNFSLQ
jgi:protein TonB